MKLAFALLLSLAAAACGGKSNPNTSTSNTDGTGEKPIDGPGTPCAQEVALMCEAGQVDRCLQNPPGGDTHECVPKTDGAASKCQSEGGNCQNKAAATACKRFEEGADWGCAAPNDGCCLNN